MTPANGPRQATQPAIPVTTAATLLLALAGPPTLAAISRRAFGGSPGLATQVGLQVLLCAIAGVLIVVVVRVERRSLDSIGLHRPDWTSAALALGAALGVTYLLPRLTGPLMTALDLGGFESGLEVVMRMPVWFRVCVALTSGFVEETLYRGYAIERLREQTGRLWLGGVLAILAFGAAHIPLWGMGPALAADLPFGAVMTGLYLWRRDLLANTGAHSLLLLVSMLTVPGVTPGTP